MEKHEVQTSPQVYARIGGVLYLITIVVGIFNEAFVKGKIFVSGDAMATAANLKSMESLWRLGIAGQMLMVICTVILSLILYVLLRPVSRNLALLATFFGLIATAADAAHLVQLVEALLPLGSAGYLKAFTPEQLNAIVSLSLKSHDIGYGIGLLLFGPFFLVAGYLIFKSRYFPRAIGILYQIGGVALIGEWLRAHHGPSLRKSDIRRHRTSLLRCGGIILPLASDQGRQRPEVNERVGISPPIACCQPDHVPH